MTRILSIVILLGVFAAGAVFGAGLVRTHAPERGGPPPMPPGPAERLIHHLQLTPAQAEELHRIERAHRDELDRLMKETMPKIRAVMDAVENELRPVLTEEQRTRLDELQRDRPPPPPFGPPPFGPPPGHHRPPPGHFPP